MWVLNQVGSFVCLSRLCKDGSSSDLKTCLNFKNLNLSNVIYFTIPILPVVRLHIAFSLLFFQSLVVDIN